MKMKADTGKPGKRPAKALATADKVTAIDRVHAGESKASVARDIGVPESTLRGWCKSEEKIRNLARMSQSSSDSERNSPQSVSSSSASVPPVTNLYTADDNGPPAKKPKMDQQPSRLPSSSSHGINENLDTNAARIPSMTQTEAAQVAVVMARLQEDPAMLLQLQGIVPPYMFTQYARAVYDYSMRETARTKSSSNNNNVSASLVTNGLQYSLSNKNKSTSAAAKPNGSHALNYGRRSLPSSLEDPTVLAPVSPRTSPELGRESRTKIRNPVLNQTRNYPNNLTAINNGGTTTYHPSLNNVTTSSNDILSSNSTFALNDSMLRYRIAQQQALALTPITDPSSRNIGQPMPSYAWYPSRTNGIPATVTSAEYSSTQFATAASTVAKKPLTKKTRATLDQLFSNNNLNVMSSSDATAGGANEAAGKGPDSDKEDGDEENKPEPIGKVEAIQHAKKFMSYLTKTTDPNVTWTQIKQFEKLLHHVENAGSKITQKQGRKTSTVVKHTSTGLEFSVKTE